ncbi:hypothetical protein YC2023_026188 [Brassica napus]
MGSKIRFFRKWAYVAEFLNGPSYDSSYVYNPYTVKIEPSAILTGRAFNPDPKTRPETDPKKPGSGRNRSDQITLSGLVTEDPRVLDPTRPKSETRWISELTM